MDMKCEKCGKESTILHYVAGDKFVGDCCHSGTPSSGVGYTKVMVGNKEYPKMSYAMKQHIVTRKVRPDGKIRPDKRWS